MYDLGEKLVILRQTFIISPTNNYWRQTMERLLSKLAAGTANLGEITGSSSNSKGLDKILALKGLQRVHMNYIYGVYLGETLQLMKLKGYLALKFSLSPAFASKIISGAVQAIASNSYRLAECYKCGGTGLSKETKCLRCSGLGQTSKKPKEYQLCSIGRSAWYKKENQQIREQYIMLVDHLLQLDSELRSAIAKNNRDN